MLPRGTEIAGATCAFAGPVTHGDEVCMTNWPEPKCVARDDLVGVGLPAAVRIVNDMVAGAEGVLDRMDRGGVGVTSLYDPGPVDPDSGNVVFLAPGTGLGAATLARTGLADPTHVPVGCECQHTAIPAFSDEMAEWIEALAQMLGHAPTWEDVVSGRGLARLHAALQAAESGAAPELPDDSETPAIAEAALSGDELAERALTIYYQVLGASRNCSPSARSRARASSSVARRPRRTSTSSAEETSCASSWIMMSWVRRWPRCRCGPWKASCSLAGGLRIAAQAARARPAKAQFRSFGG